MENENPIVVPFTVYESAMARATLVNKRLFIAFIATAFLLVCSWVGFFVYEAQFEDIVMTQEATTDGGGDAVVSGVATGDINNYYGESEADNQSPSA